MTSILSRPLFVILGLAYMVSMTSSASGEVLFQKDFTQVEESSKSDLSGMEFWTGEPQNSWGKISIEPLPSGVTDSPKRALNFCTNSTNPTASDGSRFCPLTIIKTPGFGLDGKMKTAVYALRFLVPINGKYRADLHFGGNWDSNATILVLDSDNLNAMEKGTPTKLAAYVTNAWQELRVEFDTPGKTYSVFLNGTQVANGVPWNNPKLTSIDSLEIVPGGIAVEKDATPVFYIEKIDISWK